MGRQRKWTKEEDDKLIHAWPNKFYHELQYIFSDRTLRAIRSRAVKLGIRRQFISNNERRCEKCDKTFTTKDFRRGRICRLCINENYRQYYAANTPSENTRSKQYKDDLRNKVLCYYGHKCNCCGEAHKDFLAIDHIHNDGAAHRQKVKAGEAMYLWLLKNNFPDGFQLLCHNCNWSKHINGGCCIHQIEEI
jgi:hypothetical protein